MEDVQPRPQVSRRTLSNLLEGENGEKGFRCQANACLVAIERQRDDATGTAAVLDVLVS